MQTQGLLYIISSVAGGGKTTLIDKLIQDHPQFRYSISYTSRPKRKMETNGVNYYFVSQKEFETLIEQDSFFEWAIVHNNYYGTPKKETIKQLEQGQKLILDIDVKGARTVRNKIKESISIFILPPCEEVWIQRLKNRGTETEKTLQTRIANGKKELLVANEFDHQIVNDDLEVAYQQLLAILKA